ncbi:MAG: hypothetical protein U9M98_00145 [Patescibacteria group bacterium]|nr:hypothetical protein [Patescibacteria group bacterium]
MQEKIGISLGSLLPWCAFPLWDFLARSFAIPIAAAMTKEIGASFWQVLPFKGVTAAALEKAEIPVRYAELAWNGTTLWRHLRGEEGNAGTPSMWQDILLFPHPRISTLRTSEFLLTFPEAVLIKHEIPSASYKSWNYLTEIHPELDMPPGNLNLAAASCLETDKPYVLDTKHMRREHREGIPSPLQPWEVFWETLFPISQAVHIQPLSREELTRTLDGYQTELWRMLSYLESFEGDLVIEIPPTLWEPRVMLKPKELGKSLRKVRKLLETVAF